MSTVNELIIELLHKEVTQLRADLAAERESRKKEQEDSLTLANEYAHVTQELTSEREAHATTCRELQKAKSDRDKAIEMYVNERNKAVAVASVYGFEDDRLPYATVPKNHPYE